MNKILFFFAISNCDVGLVKSVNRSRRDWLRLPACADRISQECEAVKVKSAYKSRKDWS